MKRKEINFDGAIRLVSEVLSRTFTDYVNALRTLHHKINMDYVKEVTTWHEYEKQKREFINLSNKRNNGKTLDNSQKEFMRNFRKKDPVPEPEKEKILHYREYINALGTKNECEIFYKSGTFSIFTLGKGDFETVKEAAYEKARI